MPRRRVPELGLSDVLDEIVSPGLDLDLLQKDPRGETVSNALLCARSQVSFETV